MIDLYIALFLFSDFSKFLHANILYLWYIRIFLTFDLFCGSRNLLRRIIYAWV